MYYIDFKDLERKIVRKLWDMNNAVLQDGINLDYALAFRISFSNTVLKMEKDVAKIIDNLVQGTFGKNMGQIIETNNYFCNLVCEDFDYLVYPSIEPVKDKILTVKNFSLQDFEFKIWMEDENGNYISGDL